MSAGVAVVRREEVDPDPHDVPLMGPRVAVLVSLNFPDMTEPTAELADVAAVRAAYVLMLRARLGSPAAWLPDGVAA